MKTVRVMTAEPYDVHIGHGLLASLGYALLERHARCTVALVSDETVHALYGKQATMALEAAGFVVKPFCISGGEAGKTLQTVDTLLNQFARQSIAGGDVLVALGGGIVCDVAGFTASVYLRGITLVHVPTTLLSAVNASIGGFAALNLPHGKNLVGSVWHPRFVVCDCDLLNSLPGDVFLDGVAECLRYGLICDRTIFEAVAAGVLDEDCADIVARCIQIKARYVAADEREQGDRRLLTLGYTMGRAVEMLSGYTVSYGHGISVGMVGATRVSEALGVCAMGCAGIIMAVLDRLGLPSETSYDAYELAHVVAVTGWHQDGGMMHIVLPETIGRCTVYPIQVSALPQLMSLAKGGRR